MGLSHNYIEPNTTIFDDQNKIRKQHKTTQQQ